MSDQPEHDPRRGIQAEAMNARALPKRFYTDAAVGRCGGRPLCPVGWKNGERRRVRRCWRSSLRALADEIVAEWAAQEGVINPATMPLTTLAMTAIDAVTGREADVAAEIVKYAGSDLLCYRAAGPEKLVAGQAELWDPVLAWFRRSWPRGLVERGAWCM